MNVRHLVTKGINIDNTVTDSYIMEGVPYLYPLKNSKKKNYEVPVMFEEEDFDVESFSDDIVKGKEFILNSPIGYIIKDKEKDELRPLSQIYNYKTREDGELNTVKGVDFGTIVETNAVKNKKIIILSKHVRICFQMKTRKQNVTI